MVRGRREEGVRQEKDSDQEAEMEGEGKEESQNDSLTATLSRTVPAVGGKLCAAGDAGG